MGSLQCKGEGSTDCECKPLPDTKQIPGQEAKPSGEALAAIFLPVLMPHRISHDDNC